MPYIIRYERPDPTEAQTSLLSSLSGWKTYTVCLVALVKIWYPIMAGKPFPPEWDTAVNDSLIAVGALAFRSAMKTHAAATQATLTKQTAEIVNAVVQPDSPAAKAQVALANSNTPPGKSSV